MEDTSVTLEQLLVSCADKLDNAEAIHHDIVLTVSWHTNEKEQRKKKKMLKQRRKGQGRRS